MSRRSRTRSVVTGLLTTPMVTGVVAVAGSQEAVASTQCYGSAQSYNYRDCTDPNSFVAGDSTYCAQSAVTTQYRTASQTNSVPSGGGSYTYVATTSVQLRTSTAGCNTRWGRHTTPDSCPDPNQVYGCYGWFVWAQRSGQASTFPEIIFSNSWSGQIQDGTDKPVRAGSRWTKGNGATAVNVYTDWF